MSNTVKLLPRSIHPNIVDKCKKELLTVTRKCHLDNVFKEYGESIFKKASLSLDKKSRDKLIAISLIIGYGKGYMSIYIARHGRDMFLKAYSEDTPEKISVLQSYDELSLLFGW